MYCIVETFERSGIVVTAVPDTWLTKIDDKNILLWPNCNGKKLKNMRQLRAAPEPDWIKISINRILFKNIRKF